MAKTAINGHHPPVETVKALVVKLVGAQLLAAELGWRQTEADDLHSPENVAKMAAGIPLTDSDRVPWFSAGRHVP